MSEKVKIANNNSEEVGVDGKDKHEYLEHSITNLKDVKDIADNLLCQITQVSRINETEDKVAEAPSLVYTLTTGSDRINKTCDQIRETLKEIHNQLFGA